MQKYFIYFMLIVYCSIAFGDTIDHNATSLLTQKISHLKDKPNYSQIIVLKPIPTKEYLDRQQQLRKRNLQKEMTQWMYFSVKNIDEFSPIVLPSIWFPPI